MLLCSRNKYWINKYEKNHDPNYITDKLQNSVSSWNKPYVSHCSIISQLLDMCLSPLSQLELDMPNSFLQALRN